VGFVKVQHITFCGEGLLAELIEDHNYNELFSRKERNFPLLLK
jgi:hypothetical protein